MSQNGLYFSFSVWSHPETRRTVTAHRGRNQLPHFLGDRQPEVLGKGLFQSEVSENDNPLHITAKYLISAHVWGK